MPTIRAENVSKYYNKKRRFLWKKPPPPEIGVVGIDLTIEQGEFVFIIGSSGAGKSTLLNLLAGQDVPDKGSIHIGSQNMARSTRWRRKRLPLTVGYVPQHHSLTRSITVKENLEQAARVGQKRFSDKENFDDRIQKVLGLIGLPDVKDRFPGELTAGECRRVELARALINSPPILVLDEVIANLDADSMWDVFLLLKEINRKGTTVVMATHNSRYVNLMRRRVVTLVDGRIYSDENKGRYGEISKKNQNERYIL